MLNRFGPQPDVLYEDEDEGDDEPDEESVDGGPPHAGAIKLS